MPRNLYTFKINGIPMEEGWEPVGWDKVKFALRRDKDGFGFDFVFSDNLSVAKYAAELIKADYEAFFIDAFTTFEITHCLGFTWTTVVNYNIYREKGPIIEVGLKETGFSTIFSSRYETVIDLFKSVGLDGGSLSIVDFTDLLLHSKLLFYTTSFKINDFLKERTVSPVVPPATTPPFQVVSEEVDFTLEPTTGDNDDPVFYSGLEFVPGITSRTIRVVGRYHTIISKATGGVFDQHDYKVLLRLIKSDGTFLSETELYNQHHDAVPYTVNFDFDLNIVFGPDTNLHFHQVFDNADTGWLAIMSHQPDMYLRLEEQSTYPVSTAKGLMVYEALNRIAESITGVQDCIRSNFFGRPDSMPRPYADRGAGSLLWLTNGFQLRKFEDRPILSSFKSLIEDLNAIWNIGFRLEGNTIRIEPKSYFYNLEPAMTLDYVSNLQESASLVDTYNEVEFKYANQGDTKQLNKLDEFNTSRQYVTPIKAHKNKLTITCNAITGGYPIEFTRRQQFSKSPTTDYPTDDNNFLIATNIAHTAAEKNENFGTVTGIISPETAYNIRLSPVRCLYRWAKVWGGGLFRTDTKTAQFGSATANSSMVAGGIAENEDITASDDIPLYHPIDVTFEYRMTLAQFIDLKSKSIFCLNYSCSNTNHKKAYIREVEYSPMRMGGTATFKLIRANANRDENAADI